VNTTDTERRLRALLGAIAPDADVGALPADADLREELELDSLDVQRFVAAIDAELDVAIADREIPGLRTLADVARRVEAAAGEVPR